MPVTRKFISQDPTYCQTLRVGAQQRFIENGEEIWQLLFGPNSQPTQPGRILKIAAEFNADSFESLRFAAYLYNTDTGAVDNAATCTFNVYRVTNPGTGWVDVPVASFAGALQTNFYFFSDQLLGVFTPADFDGGQTICVEAVVTRLGQVFRDRIYVNHLGIYDTTFRLRQDVEFLDVTKLDE